MHKGISPIVAIVLLSLLTIMSFSGLMTFYTRLSSEVQDKSFEELKSIGTDCIRIKSQYSNVIVVENCGDGIINNETIKVFFDGREVPFMVKKEILKDEIGEIYFFLDDDKCDSTLQYTISILTPHGKKIEESFEYPSDLNNNSVNERCIKGRLAELSIVNVRSKYLYDGIPTLSITWWWPLLVDLSIGYKSIKNEEILGFLEDPLKSGDLDFKIIKCDDSLEGCVPVNVGDTGRCTDGVIKEYGELEDSTRLTLYADDSYRDCSTSNPVVIITQAPRQISKDVIRLDIRNLHLGGVGKYNLCMKYKERKTYKEETSEECMEFIVTRATLTGTRISNSLKNYGDTIQWNVNFENLYYFNNIPSYADGLRCRVTLWDYFIHPASIPGTVVTLRRSNSWHVYSYLGIFFSNRASDREKTKVNATLDLSESGCRVGSIYTSRCGWFWGVDHRVPSKKFSCKKVDNKWKWVKEPCNNKRQCDEFEHTGLFGEIFNMTIYLDNNNLYYLDMRLQIRCPSDDVFGDPSKKFKFRIWNVDKFYVNDMDYSDVLYFEEPFPPVVQQYNINDQSIISSYTCQLTLNFCGKARYLYDLWDWPLWQSVWWSSTNPTTTVNGEYVCVGGPQCPRANC